MALLKKQLFAAIQLVAQPSMKISRDAERVELSPVNKRTQTGKDSKGML